MCLAAKRHAVPVTAIAAFYKFTPSFVSDRNKVLIFGSPDEIVPASEIPSLKNVEIVNPMFDLIPAQLISLYISPTTAFTPSHVYRLLGDYYPSDVTNIACL